MSEWEEVRCSCLRWICFAQEVPSTIFCKKGKVEMGEFDTLETQ
jgi:hypothetical protein